MKILQCKIGQIYDIGFIDPNFVHETSLKDFCIETENNLIKALSFFETKREIIFPYNFKWVLLSSHILFCFLDVKCIIDDLCVRSFHFILLIIKPDKVVVQVMHSRRKPIEKWTDMQECLQSQFQSLWHYIGSFPFIYW